MTSKKRTSPKTIIYLLRNDLRLHDNECFHYITTMAESFRNNKSGDGGSLLQLVPLYCFQSNHYFNGTRQWGFSRVGEHRARFILEAVEELKMKLESLGSNLIVKSCFEEKTNGNPLEAVKNVIQQLNIARKSEGGSSSCTLIFHEEAAQEEVEMEDSLRKLCKELGVRVKTFWGGATLYHKDDISMFKKIRNNKKSAPNIPDAFMHFRKAVWPKVKVRSPLPTPTKLPPIPNGIVSDALPHITHILNSSNPDASSERVSDDISAFPFKGGETAGLKRLHDYLWGTNLIMKYKRSRKKLVGTGYSTKFSAWLAIGNLSVRTIYEQVKKFEESRNANPACWSLIFELTWRDYFRYVCLKYGSAVFQAGGLLGKDAKWKHDDCKFWSWQNGKTGIPFVDANMRELLKTGWMSNTGRKIVASFLVKDLKLDWRSGAEWFESMLIDHDVCSNYGNWNYAAGMSDDPRANKKFNILKQAREHDPKGEFVKLWVPELAPLADSDYGNPGKIHVPWKVGRYHLKRAGVELGETYPKPIIKAKEWERQYSRCLKQKSRRN